MNIGEAVEAMKRGERVTRPGWNGRGMWIFIFPVEAYEKSVESKLPEGFTFDFSSPPLPNFVAMKTTDNFLVPWTCNQTDLLATDWEIVEE